MATTAVEKPAGRKGEKRMATTSTVATAVEKEKESAINTDALVDWNVENVVEDPTFYRVQQNS